MFYPENIFFHLNIFDGKEAQMTYEEDLLLKSRAYRQP